MLLHAVYLLIASVYLLGLAFDLFVCEHIFGRGKAMCFALKRKMPLKMFSISYSITILFSLFVTET